jgi:uncharacterized membrane protein YjjP (DUF1212 family)
MNILHHHEQILNFAVKAGELMLKSGAETYRVEDTITRILQANPYEHIDTFVIPTGIIVTVQDDNLSLYTKVARVKNRSTRLDRIELINQLSRDYVLGNISFDQAVKQLEEISHLTTYSPQVIIFGIGISCSFFSVMFNGNLLDFFLTFPLGLLVGYIQYILGKKNIVNYFVLFICSLLIGTGVMIYYYIFREKIQIEPIVIGCIMPLVPGVAFTNAVRDVIGDELLSGISRATEALLMAVSLAAGIGISLSIGFKLGGLL